jgi:Zn-dependent M28 family amino/carboxypeptidase
VANINIDMIGRNPPDKLLLTPTSNHKAYNGMAKIAEQCAAKEGFPQLGSADSFWNRSDHINFSKMGLPTAFLFSGIHEDYHKETDTIEKIDFDKIRRITRIVVRMLAELQTDELNLVFEPAEKKD